MPPHLRRNWHGRILDVIRSRHDAWLGLGLGGAPADQVMVALTTDVMHVCKREGIDINRLIEQSQANFRQPGCFHDACAGAALRSFTAYNKLPASERKRLPGMETFNLDGRSKSRFSPAKVTAQRRSGRQPRVVRTHGLAW